MGMIVTPPNGRALADEWERQVLASGIEKRPNYTGFSVTGRYACGYLCELGMAQALRQTGRRFRHRVKTDGKSHGVEIVGFSQGKAFGIEVKGRRHAKATEFRKSKAQWDRDSHVTVGARVVNGGSVELMGWLWTSQIEDICLTRKHPGGGESWFAPWDKLHPIGWLIGMLDEGGEEHEAHRPSASVPDEREAVVSDARMRTRAVDHGNTQADAGADPLRKVRVVDWTDEFPG